MSFPDLVALADEAVLGHLGSVTVRYQSAGYDEATVSGIFDDRFVLADDARAGVETKTIALWLRLADLPVRPEDDEPILIIDDQRYRIRERQPDGAVGGSILLLLHRAD